MAISVISVDKSRESAKVFFGCGQSTGADCFHGARFMELQITKAFEQHENSCPGCSIDNTAIERRKPK